MGVYTIAGGKGGVGKSTTTASLGIALYDAGFDVALVDADLSMANLGELLGVDSEQGVHHVLTGRASVQEAVVELSAGLYLIPGDQSLGFVGEADPANLRDVVAPLAEAVDVVLVDTGAGLGHETLVAAGLADGVLVVSTPVEAAVDDVSRTVEFVDHADATVLGAVVTRTNDRTDFGRIADDLGAPVLGAIPEDPAVGTDPATTGPAGAAYRRLAAALVAQCQEEAGTVSAPASVEWQPPEQSDAGDEATSDSSPQRGLFSFGD